VVTICDVGPRDGLQNLPQTLDPSLRAELCNRLAAVGLPRVEAVSFVSDERVPQMAGAEEVVSFLAPAPTVFAGLVLNERGYERLVAAGLAEAHLAVAVSESFSRENANAPVEEAAAAAERILAHAREDGIRATVTLSTAFGCPFEGPVDPGRVTALAERLAGAGAAEVVYADTIGVGVPRQVKELLAVPVGVPVGVHFHNTRNTGFANAYAALEAGATVFDASIGGIGGCPFAPRATGNIATEDLAYLLHGEGVETGIDLGALIGVAEWLESVLGRELEGQLYRAGLP
jgi:isopropylmalate/homocitrate/citramalate synthase